MVDSCLLFVTYLAAFDDPLVLGQASSSHPGALATGLRGAGSLESALLCVRFRPERYGSLQNLNPFPPCVPGVQTRPPGQPGSGPPQPSGCAQPASCRCSRGAWARGAGASSRGRSQQEGVQETPCKGAVGEPGRSRRWDFLFRLLGLGGGLPRCVRGCVAARTL